MPVINHSLLPTNKYSHTMELPLEVGVSAVERVNNDGSVFIVDGFLTALN